MRKKVLIAVGGTGGHIYPALALAQQLKKRAPDTEVQFIGGELSANRFFVAPENAVRDIPCATFSGGVFQKLQAVREIAKGVGASRKVLKQWQPDVIVGFGSYHTLPTLLAAKFSSVPVVLHEGNRVAGKVNRKFAKAARVTGTHFPQTDLGEGRALEVGMPLREGYTLAYGSREDARKKLGLSPNRFTFLVFGGSQGALAVNALFCSALSGIQSDRSKNFQVLHYTGSNALTEELEAEYEAQGVTAVVREFEERMDLAWLSADLAVTRSGAMTVAELMEFEVPSILIPYPHATDNHQERNADFVVETGGAIKLLEDELTPELLADSIRSLVAKDQEKMQAMRRKLREAKESRRHRDFCSVVCEVAGIRAQNV